MQYLGREKKIFASIALTGTKISNQHLAHDQNVVGLNPASITIVTIRSVKATAASNLVHLQHFKLVIINHLKL